MATTQNGYTDLIHLFIDGEATETERNTLFNALKDSPELQDEFHSAMELKKAFATDIMNLQPPSYLESAIAERAGILVAASAAAANAPVIVSAVSNAVSNVAPVATGLLSKGVLTMIVGTSVGILSTIGVIKLTSNNNSAKTTSPVAPQAITRQAEPVHIAPQSFTTVDQFTPMTMAPAEVVEKSTQPAEIKNERVNRNVNENPIQSVKDNSSQKVISEKTPVIAEKKDNTEVVSDNKNNSSVVETPKKDEPNMAMISSVTPKMPTLNAIGGETDHHLFNSSTLMDNEPVGFGRLSARISGIITSQLYQGSNITLPIWDNLGLGVKYDFDASNSFGIEGGQETFPLYLSNGKGGYENHQSITWIGGSWTYTAVYLDLPLGIHPEARILFGESNSGPIGKFSFGFITPITPRLSFAIDGEETMLPINSNGANLFGNKLAATAAFIFHF